MFKLQSFQRVILQNIIIAQQGVLPFCMCDAPRGSRPMRQIVCLVVPGIVLLIVLTVFLRRFVNDVNNSLSIIKRDDLWHEVIVISQLIGIFVVTVNRVLYPVKVTLKKIKN